MNCIIIDDDPIVQKQLSSFIQKSDLLNLKGLYKNPIEAFDAIQDNNIDLVFLDIEMPEMSGLEYLEEFKSKFQIIVISGDRRYALETFEYGVVDYLLKPIEYSRFIRSVNRGIERAFSFDNDLERNRIFVRINNKFVRIDLNDVVIVDVSKEADVVVTSNKKYNIKSDVINFNKLSKRSGLIQISEYCLVNKSKIVDVCNGELVFDKNYNLECIKVDEALSAEILKDIKQ